MVLIVQYSCSVVSVFGSGGKLVSVLHTYVLRVQYNCGVVLVFWSLREIVIDLLYVVSVQYSCAQRLISQEDRARCVRDFSHETLVSSRRPGLARNARPMYIWHTIRTYV